MKLLDRLRNRAPQPKAAASSASDPAGSPGDGLPIVGYDRLDEKEIHAQLSSLSQVDLRTIEDYERANLARPVIMNRLRWLLGSEPIEGYDQLETREIVEFLAGADAQTLKAVRDYERRHHNRRDVLEEVVRTLPSAPPSAEEVRFREEQADRVSKALKKSPPPPQR